MDLHDVEEEEEEEGVVAVDLVSVGLISDETRETVGVVVDLLEAVTPEAEAVVVVVVAVVVAAGVAGAGTRGGVLEE